MKNSIVNITVVLLFCFSASILKGQNEDIRPQIWNNFYVGWNLTDKFVVRGAAAYNVLLSSEAPWNEITTMVSGAYKFHRIMEATAGLYIAGTQQSKSLRSFEYRPYAGFRISSIDERRWLISNLSRIEIRAFRYSDKTTDLALRLRNRTYAVVSLIRPSLNDDKNLYLFGYFEAFYNFEQEVRERFFNQFKYKLGFGYRLSYPWRFDIGIIYQDSENNVGQPSQLPVIINTNWIVAWGIAYIIRAKEK